MKYFIAEISELRTHDSELFAEAKVIFPRGRVIHKNLSTAYTDLSALCATLKLEDFSGTIEVDFPEAKGVLIIDSGEVVNGEVWTGGNTQRMVGEEAVHILLGLSKQKEGIISIYQLLPEQIALIANHLDDEMLFKDLSTHFVHLDQFLFKLKEEKHTGFIEVMTPEHHPMGVLFLEGGDPVGMFTTPKTGPSVFGLISVPAFIENSIKHDSFFNVYGKKEPRPQTERNGKDQKEFAPPIEERESAEGNKEGLRETLAHFQELLSIAERLVDSLSSPGAFKKAFRRALIEKSEEFGFLDPFAGEFEYGNGTLRFTGEAGKEGLARGIMECFRFTQSHLEEELPKEKMVSLKLKAGIESFIEQHRGALERLKLEEIFSTLLN